MRHRVLKQSHRDFVGLANCTRSDQQTVITVIEYEHYIHFIGTANIAPSKIPFHREYKVAIRLPNTRNINCGNCNRYEGRTILNLVTANRNDMNMDLRFYAFEGNFQYDHFCKYEIDVCGKPHYKTKLN